MWYQIWFLIISQNVLLFLKNSDALIDVPKRVNQKINAESLHQNYYVIACKKPINFDYNTLKTIHLSSYFYNECVSTFYNDKDFTFGYLFREYIKPSLQNIDHTALIEE